MNEKKTNTFKEIYTPVNLMNGLATLFTGMRSRMAANYRMFFMTSLLMIPAAKAGMIGSIVSLMGTVSSLLWGFIMQKSNPKMGRIRFWVLFGGMACGICTFLSFVDFHLSGPLTTIYLIVFCSGMDVFYNAYYPASIGVISLLADTTQARTNMTAVRNTFNSLSKIIYGAVNVGIIAWAAGLFGNETAGYTTLALLIGALICTGALILSIFLKGKEQPNDQVAQKNDKNNSLPIPIMVKLIFQKPMLTAMGGVLGKSIAYSQVAMLVKYYYTYVANSAAGMTFYLTFSAIFLLVGTNIAPHIAKKFGSKKTIILGYIIYSACLVFAFFSGANATVVTIALCLGEFASGFYNVCDITLFTDSIDYVNLKNGVDAKSFLLPLYSLTGPLSTMICSAVTGFGLEKTGFDAAAVTITSIWGIRALMCLVPVVFFILGIVFYSLSPVNDKSIAELKKQSVSA